LKDEVSLVNPLSARANQGIVHGLHLVYMDGDGATLLVGTWQREKQE